jgi:hypothetical protein
MRKSAALQQMCILPHSCPTRPLGLVSKARLKDEQRQICSQPKFENRRLTHQRIFDLVILAFGLALLAQIQVPADGPISTSPRQIIEAARDASSPPEDSAGYVAWCQTTLEGYVGLYDRVMPEVTRIERAFPSPEGGATASLAVYPQLRDTANDDIKTFARALETAQAATPLDITPQISSGREAGTAFWANAATARTADVARVWMSWSPPERCSEEAEKLAHLAAVEKSTTAPVAEAQQATAATGSGPVPDGAESQPDIQSQQAVLPLPTEETSPIEAAGLRRAPNEQVTQEPETTVAPPKPAPAEDIQPSSGLAPDKPEAAPKKDFEYDPAKPQPCPGRLEPVKRKGKSVIMCRVARH